MRAAQYNQYGPPDVIELVEAPDPAPPGPGEVMVRVIAAGLNPADSKMRRGQTPIVELPARLGREFSGTVVSIGLGVNHVKLGQSVLGTGQGVMADLVVVPAEAVMPIPEGLTFDHAAVLPVAAQTAWAAVESQDVQPGEVVVVSAAAGGVGVVMCQLLRDKGALVIGTASEHNHDFLEALGATPVDYHGDLATTLREATPRGLHRVFDNSGAETIEAALELGVPRENINSISGAGAHYGVATVGRVGLNVDIITKLAAKISDGSLVIPILVQPFDEVIKAYIDLEERRTFGKNVVRMDNLPDRDILNIPPLD